ncbi:DNA-binding winged helix-turn-helix (wHTH) protein/tetratricopeptide (TPR) repeat protein [Silvibacterium bohemicum]|uniref:DNA-binding winged helix-turn-helix (WHTH) protein/tetratricopeptide (TPR) repeat protein n=1 Tax=Silvibacterium bohemicum TaxID=1577686 RepID=A0A841JSP3_9BACT|nr:winged helix-turn-helix domain-containing protein [Silvibacterium bohemicum]MBB6143527.1 DNA-binding winged helix-turn-helix (wHTH) protein/tetratricopeptide (TPR) repeat protein [Silvibacterium bohemicum]
MTETIQPAYDGYRFGRFEVRIRNGVLLRDEKRIKIEELPFQLLLVLLESPGEVVSKETLRSRLWSDRIFGELDNGLHVAAAKLREALGEKAGATARHIETIRGRGYRFNGSVEPIFSPAFGMGTDTAFGDAAVASGQAVPDDAGRDDPPNHLEQAAKTESFLHRRSIRIAAFALSVLIVSAAGLVWFYPHRHRPLADSSDPVVLGGFINNSGDDSYNGMGHAFRVKLEESPYLNLIPEQSFLGTVPEPASAPLKQLLKGCASLGGKVLITGAIMARSTGYEVTTAARSCTDGSLLTTEKAKAESRETVLAALDQATNRMRRSLGESGASLQRFNMPLAQATTSSLAALRAFTLGEEKRDSGQEFEAIPDYKLAVDLDPQFAMAYARLGAIYSNAAEQTQSADYFKKAFDLREHTTDRERLYIAAHYYLISGQIQRAIEAYELWRSLYPRDASPYQNLALEYLDLGEPEKAADVARTAVQLDGASSMSQAALARMYLETGEQGQLQTLCSHVQGGKGDSAMLHESCFLLAFLRNDEAAMQEQILWSRGNAAESELLDDVAWVAMYQGKLNAGRKLFAHARQTALAQGFSELAATIDVDEALLEVDCGYRREARMLALDALRLAPQSLSIQAGAALALGRSGDTALAESEAAKAAAQAPLDTILNDAQLPSIRAAVQLAKHNPQAAIQALERARPYDACSALNLAPAYYRGLAYQDAGHPDKAAAEFRSVIGYLGLMPDSPYIPLAAIQLARVLHRMGDAPNAAKAERQAKQAWQHADPDFLPLRKGTS